MNVTAPADCSVAAVIVTSILPTGSALPVPGPPPKLAPPLGAPPREAPPLGAPALDFPALDVPAPAVGESSEPELEEQANVSATREEESSSAGTDRRRIVRSTG